MTLFQIRIFYLNLAQMTYFTLLQIFFHIYPPLFGYLINQTLLACIYQPIFLAIESSEISVSHHLIISLSL